MAPAKAHVNASNLLKYTLCLQIHCMWYNVVISNEFIRRDDLKSQQNEIEEKLGQAPVEPEQKVLVREDTEDNNRGRRVSV